MVCVAATIRTDFASSRPASRSIVVIRPSSNAAERYVALRFARAYLSWTHNPANQEDAVSPFISAVAQPGAGLTPAPGTSQQVAWMVVAAERREPAGVRDYTIAADAGGAVRYIAVAVQAGEGGGFSLARYPALIAAPSVRPASALGSPALPAVRNAAVVAVVDRALHNYVDGSAVNLAADLARGAVVTAIAPGLALQSVQNLAVESSRVVLATVTVSDRSGDTFTLDYEVDVAEIGERWEITQIGP
jgi:hypothetical protein